MMLDTRFDDATGVWTFPNGREFDLARLKTATAHDNGFTLEFQSGETQEVDTFSGGEMLQYWLRALMIGGRRERGNG